jgi:hypothetical protein
VFSVGGSHERVAAPVPPEAEVPLLDGAFTEEPESEPPPPPHAANSTANAKGAMKRRVRLQNKENSPDAGEGF